MPAHLVADAQKTDVEMTMVDQQSIARRRRIRLTANLVFCDAEKADRWMRNGLAELGGKSPLSTLGSVDEERLIKSILAKIAWGAAA